MAITPDLSDKQNQRLREAMLKVRMDRFGDKSQPMAKALGLSQPTISEFLRGNNGASLDTAQRFAAFVRTDVWEILGADERRSKELLTERGRIQTEARRVPVGAIPASNGGPRQRREYRDLYGYLDALREATVERPNWSPVIWEMIARSRVPGGVEEAAAGDLIALGDRYEHEEKQLERRDYLTPVAAAGKPTYKRHMSDIRGVLGRGKDAQRKTR